MTDVASRVPTWPELVIPTLKVLSDGETRHRRVIFDDVASEAGIDAEARSEALKSGGSRYEQRMGWVLSNLSKAGWVTRPQRGEYLISDRGREGLRNHESGLDFTIARQIFNPYWEAIAASKVSAPVAAVDQESVDINDPIEEIDDAITRIESEVAQELLERLRDSHPDFFEETVVKLLTAMGYGGAQGTGKRIGGSNDGGVDGVIDQDALGLDQIYVQAKRYRDGNNIGRETIQAFVGALQGFGASRGVFLTTSAFTAGAIAYAKSVHSRVILIDGERLVDLMIRYRVGVEEHRTFSVVQLDEDFFG